MGRHEVEAYFEKTFDWTALLARLPEGRQHPQHSCQKVFAAVFWGAIGRIPSFHQLEYECRAGGLRHRIGPLSEDTLRYSLERLAPEAVWTLGCEVARRLKRNGVLRTEVAQGLIVAAVDGIEICQSYVRCCDTCLERTVERVIDGVKQPAVQYYHRIGCAFSRGEKSPCAVGVGSLGDAISGGRPGGAFGNMRSTCSSERKTRPSTRLVASSMAVCRTRRDPRSSRRDDDCHRSGQGARLAAWAHGGASTARRTPFPANR